MLTVGHGGVRQGAIVVPTGGAALLSTELPVNSTRIIR